MTIYQSHEVPRPILLQIVEPKQKKKLHIRLVNTFLNLEKMLIEKYKEAQEKRIMSTSSRLYCNIMLRCSIKIDSKTSSHVTSEKMKLTILSSSYLYHANKA